MQLKKIASTEDIPADYKDTPIGQLIQYQNLNREFRTFDSAQLLIGMCMDNRKHLRIPENFAYIIRTGGGNLRNSEFKISYAIAIGGVRHIALIAHNHCGMVNLCARKEKFISGLMHNAGWSQSRAEEHFLSFAPLFEIDNEIDFVISEQKRLQEKYPLIQVVPLYYTVEDNRLSAII